MSLGRAALACCLAALLSCGVAGQAHTQTIDRLDAAAVATEETVFPGFEPGALRGRAQLVWDAARRKLVRRTYEIWDPLAAQGFDVFWVPDDATADRPGPVAGRGRLVWREPGAASYDRHATIAHYKGDMAGGRANGTGEFLHRSGAAYRGAWKDGLMDGQGRLLLPNGDEYVGGFRAGRRHGAGVYIDRTGIVYEGAFSAGLRDGEGVFVPVAGAAYRSLWRSGVEVASRVPIPGRSRPVSRAEYKEYDDVRLGVSVDRRTVFDLEGLRPLLYVAESNPDGLRIFPDDQHFLDVWRGKAPIQVPSDVLDTINNTISLHPSFLGPAEQFAPLPLLLDFENTASQPIRIVGGFLDVSSSISDLEPAVQLVNDPVEKKECNYRTPYPEFSFQNFGWSAAEAAVMRLTFAGQDGSATGPVVERRLADLVASAKIDLREDLGRAGIDVGEFGMLLDCPQADLEECLASEKSAGTFGEYAAAVRLFDVFLMLPASGTLSYDWHDAAGVLHQKQSTFQTDVPIGNFNWITECGEGSDFEEFPGDPFEFRLDQTQYRIGLNIHEDVPGGIAARWRVRLDAPKSSVHDFRVVLQLADGREVASRPVNLLYFKPNPAVYDGPFGPPDGTEVEVPIGPAEGAEVEEEGAE
jgi:hypothetical protein